MLISLESFFEKLGFSLSLIIIFLAILAWYVITTKRREEKILEPKKALKKTDQEKDQDDGEYHNDFSKVPAGKADSTQPMPRSIGYGYGDGGRSFEDDLANISSKINEDKENE